MSVERVVDAALVAGRHAEPDLRRAILDRLARSGGLLSARPVLLGDVFDDVLAFGRHARIEFEGLEMDVGLNEATDPPQGLLEPAQPDYAPGAGNIRDEVDLQWLGHGRIPV